MRCTATRQVEGAILAPGEFDGGTRVLSWATGGRRLQHFDPGPGLRWSVPPRIRGSGRAVAPQRGRPRAKAAWRPETWLAEPDRLTVSVDAVLARLCERPRSGIGSSQVVGTGDGALRFTTRRGPLGEGSAAGGGAFETHLCQIELDGGPTR